MDVREKATNDKRLIDADALLRDIEHYHVSDGKMPHWVEIQQTIDAVPVVRCEKCVLHGDCVTEDAFVLSRIENPFCCAGKLKEGADNG